MLSGRVVIPIHDEQGQLVAYAGRSVDGREPRYRFPAGFGKSPVLFNFHRAAASVGDRVIAVEGFFDCLRIRQAGWECVVALLGTELYEHQAELLRARFSRVLLLLDGDEAGRLGGDRVAARLRNGCEVDVIKVAGRRAAGPTARGRIASVDREGDEELDGIQCCEDESNQSGLRVLPWQERCQSTLVQAAASGRLRSANDPICG